MIDDLKAYATEKGVLYFHIFVYGKRKEIFYASLFPSKVADYLEKANVRGNKKSLNIPYITINLLFLADQRQPLAEPGEKRSL